MSGKFQVGDRVRIIQVGNPDPEAQRLIGEECYIQSIDTTLLWPYVLSITPSGKEVCACAKNIAHAYDGNEPASWSDCVWQPRGVRA